ncbi:MAG: GTP diphosphokinase [Moraxellaceae bacterium]|nr:GTP diphosphokinase [Moraxellaceae bacterium]
MVKVRADYPQHADGSVNLDAWLDRVGAQVQLHDVAQLKRACEFAERIDRETSATEHVWSTRTSSFLTGLAMADILADLHLDQESLMAAVLYRGVREGKTTQTVIEKEFGPDIAQLIDGVLRMAAISQVINPDRRKVDFGQSQQQLDNMRKMLVAMIDDVRVALIKLAERTFAIREIKDATPERRQRVAREIFDIYAPLAHRLGIGHIKWELEDLSFRYLEPEAYKQIAQLLDEKRLDRDEYIQNIIKSLKEMLDRMGMRSEVSGRAKHIYSIWRKMQRKKISFNEVYDVRAVRVLVPEVRDCYAALGVVHSLWKHIPREFDDYIATPKENGYRSLHTAVIGPAGKPLEVQIRTFDMHEEAELGVCAHWVYKEGAQAAKGAGKDAGYEGKIAWLRQVLEWQEDMGDSQLDDFADQLNQAIHDERIYVFTRDGHVIDLQAGATPLDFAYHIHSAVGNGCRGAKVNGRIVPLNYKLQTGEQVDIMTLRGGAPSRDWLSASLGYLHTSRAQAKVRHWFKQQDREKNISEGREMLDREFSRLSINVSRGDLDRIASALNVRQADDVLAGVGAGDLRVGQVIQQLGVRVDGPHEPDLLPEDVVSRSRRSVSGSPVMIEGVGNLLTHMAGCCHPIPGEPIVGYVTQGRGVSVHTRDCPEMLRLQAEEPARVLEVQWNQSEATVYPADIHIRAWDRTGLLRDITSVLANEHVNVTGVQTQSNKSDGTASMQITVEVGSLDALRRVLLRIEQQPNVIEARRHMR